MADKQDYYETLGVPRNANLHDIKKAFKRLAREHHPDVNAGAEESEARFKEINEAYQVLSDPEKKEIYDRYGHQGLDQSFGGGAGYTGFGDFGDIFDMFFGGGGGQSRSAGRTRPSAERGSDLRYDVELTLEESAHGVSRNIRLSRLEVCDACKGSGAQAGSHPETCGVCHGSGQVRQQQQSFFGTQIRITTCPRCHGEGHVISAACPDCSGQGRLRKTIDKTVDIPAGVDTGMRIRLTGEGDAGRRGGPNGDLYVVTHIRKHDFFERRGSDLWCEVKIGFPLAALGGTIEVRTIDSHEELEVSPGTQPGEVYSLRGKGMPDPTGGRQGDLNVVLKIETPTRLNEEQKELLRNFAASRGEEIKEVEGKSFFERVKDAISGL
ncbi:MAG: molecular chaperone DnaJ [Chloroflexi bacterium]|nr:molecular chaperone DnaJ [Chloroflexota bacterium]